jgi:acyl carrier protein
MSSPTSSSPLKPVTPAEREEKIRHLPAAAQAAFRLFEKNGDVTALDPVIDAILEDFIPRPPAQPFSAMPGSTLLMDDLGFDSLAITEVVFFTEDLFGISIANEEIIQVRSLDDLRGFVRRKVSGRAPG